MLLIYRELNSEENICIKVNWKSLEDILKESTNLRLKLVTMEYINSL